MASGPAGASPKRGGCPGGDPAVPFRIGRGDARAGSVASSRRCANLAEHLAMVSAITDAPYKKPRLGIMLRDIGFIACSELVDAVARYHHSTPKSDDCPTDLSSDILRCVNIALACNRLEELVYGPDPCPKKEALEAIQAETEEGVLASRGS